MRWPPCRQPAAILSDCVAGFRTRLRPSSDLADGQFERVAQDARILPGPFGEEAELRRLAAAHQPHLAPQGLVARRLLVMRDGGDVLRSMCKPRFQPVERHPGVELLLQEQRRIAVHAVEDVDAFTAHGADAVAQDRAPGGANAVVEKQHVFRRQPERCLKADLSEQRLADHHAGEMHEAPVLQHHTGKIGDFHIGRRLGKPCHRGGFGEFSHAEVVIEVFAAGYGCPVTIGIKK